jgi:hypothetical protein
MSYDAQVVFTSINQNFWAVVSLMMLCLVSTFSYLVTSFRVAHRDKSYTSPLLAVGFFAIHDTGFVLQWDKWFNTYSHWWPQLWAISLIGTTMIEFSLCYMVYKYGREELMPKLTQAQFGAAILACLIAIAVVWTMVKQIINDDLSLISFAFTGWWPLVGTTLLLVKRQSMRGQSRLMIWCLLTNAIGMFGAWYFLAPYFRSPLWLAYAGVSILWSIFNVWLMNKYPKYDPEAV